MSASEHPSFAVAVDLAVFTIRDGVSCERALPAAFERSLAALTAEVTLAGRT